MSESECSICFEAKSVYKVLSNCSHDFCASCLLEIKKQDYPKSLYGYILCPFCSTRTDLQNADGVNSLANKIRPFKDVLCDGCSRNFPLNEHFWCNNCKEAVCSICFMKKHNKHDNKPCDDDSILRECLLKFKPFATNAIEREIEIEDFCTKLSIELKKRLSFSSTARSFVTEVEKLIGEAEGKNNEDVNKKIKMAAKIVNACRVGSENSALDLEVLKKIDDPAVAREKFEMPKIDDVVQLFFNGTGHFANGNGYNLVNTQYQLPSASNTKTAELENDDEERDILPRSSVSSFDSSTTATLNHADPSKYVLPNKQRGGGIQSDHGGGRTGQGGDPPMTPLGGDHSLGENGPMMPRDEYGSGGNLAYYNNAGGDHQMGGGGGTGGGGVGGQNYNQYPQPSQHLPYQQPSHIQHERSAGATQSGSGNYADDWDRTRNQLLREGPGGGGSGGYLNRQFSHDAPAPMNRCDVDVGPNVNRNLSNNVCNKNQQGDRGDRPPSVGSRCNAPSTQFYRPTPVQTPAASAYPVPVQSLQGIMQQPPSAYQPQSYLPVAQTPHVFQSYTPVAQTPHVFQFYPPVAQTPQSLQYPIPPGGDYQMVVLPQGGGNYVPASHMYGSQNVVLANAAVRRGSVNR